MLRLLILLFLPLAMFSQHTFSIVAIDTISGEIGSAGATCLDTNMLEGEEGALVISDIILGIGAIHTQAWWNPENQKSARYRMEQGDTPEQIIEWLIHNDNKDDGHTVSDRQYGIVSIINGKPMSAGYTGEDNLEAAAHITGPNYNIQGNILIHQDVLADMERAFLNSNGSLGDRLMAGMQAAKRPGADSRCLSANVSSLSAFLRVAQPSDTDPTYGNLSLDINIGVVPRGTDPIDLLQNSYNDWKNNPKN